MGQNNGKAPVITGKEIEILLYINSGLNGPRGISQKSSIPKSTAHRVLKKLKSLNLIFNKQGNYFLTEYGKTCCSNIGRLSPINKPIFRLHKFTISVPIVNYSNNLFKHSKSIFEKIYFSSTVNRHLSDSVSVSIHPSKLSFVLPSVCGNTLEEAELNSSNLINFVLESIKSKYPQIKLGQKAVTSHIDDNHIAIINHSFSIPFTKFVELFGEKYCYKGSNVEFDFSTGKTELEFIHKLYAKKHCYNLAKFTDWIVKDDNIEKLIKLIEYGSEL
jgi:predicted transcriptional regulator